MEKFEYVYQCICNYKYEWPFNTDNQIIIALMKSLSEEEIGLLYSYKYTIPFPISIQIRNLMGKILVASFQELLSDFKERKKGVVQDTRNKLLATFPNLPFPEKKEMLSVFLQSGKIDRRWAYGYIKWHWDTSFQNIIEEAWGKYMDKECASIILRYSSDEMINRYTDELCAHDYREFCLRVGKKSLIEIDENKLSELDYLYVMAKLHRPIDTEKINLLLYSKTASYLLDYNFDSLVGNDTFYNWGQTIWCIGEARCWNELVDFFEWKKSIRETTLASRFTKGNRENFKALFIAYSYVYFPAKYAHLLGDRIAHFTNLLSMKDGEKLAIEEIRFFI